MRRLRTKLRVRLRALKRVRWPEVLVPSAFFGGGVCIVAGVALVSLALALVLGGGALIVGAIAYELSAEREGRS